MPMTSQTEADEVRLIEAQAAPTRFARGWHCLGLIRDFGDGKPHAINAFGQKLVVFRSGDGDISVLDSYCRHMGGDLRRPLRTSSDPSHAVAPGQHTLLTFACEASPGRVSSKTHRIAYANSF